MPSRDEEGHVSLMTTAQVADALGVTNRRVRELIASGALKAEKVGGVWAVHREDLKSVQSKGLAAPDKAK